MFNFQKSRWGLRFSALGLVLVLAAALPSPAWGQSRKDRTEFDRLEQIAWREGKVNVIVRIDVPRIGEMTAASTRYKTGDVSASAQKDLAAADQFLKEAIELTAWKVVSDLQGRSSRPRIFSGASPFSPSRPLRRP